MIRCKPSTIAAVALVLALVNCKQASRDNRRSGAAGTSDAVPPLPGPISSERSEAELKAAFAEMVEKYRQTTQVNYATNSIARSLQPKRKLKTLNIKMRDSITFIAKTAKLAGSANTGAPIRAAGGIIKKELRDSNVLNVEFPDATDEKYLAAVMDFLKSDSRIEIVEPDFIVKANAVPNDPQFSELWGLANPSTGVDLKAVAAWDLTTGNRSVIVGVIDSGIDCTHVDLAANCWINPGESGKDGMGRDKSTNGIDDDANGYIDDWQGWNFVDGNNKPHAGHSHGTHVAGTIGAVGNNAIGVAGVNWQVSLVPLKFLDNTGQGYISDALAASDYATKMKFFATNNSWGGGGFSSLMLAAIVRANAADSLFIAAAGTEQNDNDASQYFPANYVVPNVVAVAAVDSNGNLAWFSNYGAQTVAVAAPGVDIMSTIPENAYAKMSGTSMAAPHVTGALALLKSKFPDDNGIRLISRLLASGSERTSLNGRVRTGAVINAYAAINNPLDITPPSPPTGLVVSKRTIDQANLEFIPSGDDGTIGVAANYSVRFFSKPILDDSDWNNATPIEAVVTLTSGKASALLQKFPVGYSGWISVRAYDKVGNASPVSESAEIKLIPLRKLQFYDGTSLNDLPPNTPWTLEADPVRGKVYSDGIGLYPANAKRRLMLRDIPLKGVQKLVLQYWTSYILERGYDFGDVFVSREGRSDIDPRKIDSVSGYAPWELRTIDLTEYAFDQAGQGAESLQIFFELRSDSSFQYEGWLIDDISILINDSLVTLTDIPDGTTQDQNLSIGISAPPGTQYSAKFLQDQSMAAADCSLDATYVNPVPQTPASQNLLLTSDSTDSKFLCLRAQIPGFKDYHHLWTAWRRTDASPMVQATGMPTSVSNAKSFTIQVTKVSPGNATTYNFALVRTQPGAKDASCRATSVTWSPWISTSQASVINVEAFVQGSDGQLALCVKGKNDAGSIQLVPTAYDWLADFTGPEIAIKSDISTPIRITNFSVNITGPADLKSCAATLIAGNASCPTPWSSYGECKISPPDSLPVATYLDGPYTLCVLGKDLAGNVSTTPKFLKWTRDTVKPVAVLSGTPPVSSKSPTANIVVSGADVATYQFSTGAAASQCPRPPQFEPQAWSPPQTAATPIQLAVVPLGDGQRTLCVMATDAAGNEQDPPSTLSWVQDTTANALRFSGLPSAISNAKSLNVGVAADEAGTYRYIVQSGNTCSATNLANALKRAITTNTTKIIYNMPLADGTYTLCASFTDNAGNEQNNPAGPTSYTWQKDTVGPIAILSETPPKETTEQGVNAKVSGNDVIDYQWSIIGGVVSCSSAVYGAFSPVATRLVVNAGGPGIKILCIKARDTAGNVQTSPSTYQWTLKAPVPPIAIISSSAPFSPTGNTIWSVVIGGARVVSWQQALIYSQTANCTTGVTYGAFTAVGSPLRINDGAADGFRTLCLRGRDTFGSVQLSPTIHRWLKITGAPLAESPAVFGTVTRGAAAGTTLNLILNRTSPEKPAENVSVKVCQLAPATGRITNCKTAVVAWAMNIANRNLSFTGITAGNWVIIVLPPQGRGRVEPLAFKQ